MRFLVCVLCGMLLAPTVWASDVASSATKRQVNTEAFHISPAYLPDHQIGESGPLVMDTTERKTTHYSSVDAVNSAINAAVVSNLNDDMHTHGKAWMKQTTVAFSFQKHWKPLYSAETVQPIGHYDDRSRQVWFTQGSVARAADIGTTLNSGLGYRRISRDERHLHGVNMFYDHRFTHHHGRVGIGYEYMSGESELRLNYYRGTVGDRLIDNATVQSVTNGYTLEYGKTFKNARWARVYGEAYHWNLKREADKNGFRMGTELQLTPHISIDIGYNKPERASGSGYGKIMFRLAGADIAWYGGKHKLDTESTVRSKMLEKVRRDNTVTVE